MGTTHYPPDTQGPDPVWAATPAPDNARETDNEDTPPESGGNTSAVQNDEALPDAGEAYLNDATASSSKDDWTKCTQCSYSGPASSFPLRLNGTGHVRTCVKHTRPRRQEVPKPSPTTLKKISWESLLDEIQTQATRKIEIDRFVHLDSSHPGACGETLLTRANIIMDGIKHAAGYRFNYKRRQDSTQKTEKSSVFTYYCAQLEGEQTKHPIHPDESKRRPKKIPKIPRFHCNGWSSITVSERMPLIVRIRITHKFAHLAVFSKRASGVGIGTNNTLSPQLTPASLVVDHSTSGPNGASASGEVSTPAAEPENSTPMSVKKTRKRKRKEPEPPITIQTVAATSGSELSARSGHVIHEATTSTNSPALPPGAIYSNITGASEFVSGSGGENAQSVRFPISPESSHITHEDPDSDPRPAPLNQDNWPASVGPTPHPPFSNNHQGRHALSQIQHPSLPPLPPLSKTVDMHIQAHVLFRSEYISELRRKANVAFAYAERPGGMSIDEARAFEAAFAPLVQLVHELEARQVAGSSIIHSLQH